MQTTIDNSALVLASKSPRRRDLLTQAGLNFKVVPSSVDETCIPQSKPSSYVKALAEAKVGDISKKYPDCWVIGADTIVLIDDTILGKPSSRKDARRMLRRLSAKTHQVLTGYAICCRAKNRRFSETIKTEVLFKKLSDAEINWYINTEEPFDKAGAYAIQGLGTFLVRSISGSYTNVVGLPICELIEHLTSEGVIGLHIEQQQTG